MRALLVCSGPLLPATNLVMSNVGNHDSNSQRVRTPYYLGQDPRRGVAQEISGMGPERRKTKQISMARDDHTLPSHDHHAQKE